MVLEKESSKTSVYNYFGNPIQHEDVVSNYLSHNENADNTQINEHLSKYLNEKAISEMIKVNSEITKILNKFKIPLKINMNILDNLVNNHLKQTRNIAIGIANNLDANMQASVNYKALAEATSLHDLAKVIIPENIINKNGRLTNEEFEIMKKHSDLSYEMLKSTDLDPQTLHLIKNHHQNAKKTGYPAVDDNFVADINLEILSLADKYSALREKRSYKKEMSKEKALGIIEEEVKQGKFHLNVFRALCAYAHKEEKSFDFKNQRKIFNLKPVNSFSA